MKLLVHLQHGAVPHQELGIEKNRTEYLRLNEELDKEVYISNTKL